MRIKPEAVLKEIDEYLEQAQERPWGNFEILMMNAKDIIESQQRQIVELEKDNEAFVKIASDEHKIAKEAEQRLFELEKELEHAYGLGEAGGFIKGHKAAKTNVDDVNTSQECVDKTENNQHEPVAWTDWENIGICNKDGESYFWRDADKGDIPLYTTPQTKPRLSDEEINKLSEAYLSFDEDLGMAFIRGQIDFARAVEERILGK